MGNSKRVCVRYSVYHRALHLLLNERMHDYTYRSAREVVVGYLTDGFCEGEYVIEVRCSGGE